MRKRFVPFRWQGLSGLPGQRTSFSEGTLTRVASGCQSPVVPFASTGRNCKGPKADAPKLFNGSSTASAVCESCSTRLPSEKLSIVSNEESVEATSIFSLRENDSGTWL